MTSFVDDQERLKSYGGPRLMSLPYVRCTFWEQQNRGIFLYKKCFSVLFWGILNVFGALSCTLPPCQNVKTAPWMILTVSELADLFVFLLQFFADLVRGNTPRQRFRHLAQGTRGSILSSSEIVALKRVYSIIYSLNFQTENRAILSIRISKYQWKANSVKGKC